MIGEELYDAASKGDVTKFKQLLQQDPYLVERVSYPCSRNLLHVATLRGQVAIIEEVLKINPGLARISDSQKSSPLHIAVEEGNLEITKRLLSVAPEMCWWRDEQGLNPVQIAAVKGHVEILEKLLEEDPLPVMERGHRGQTVLHLCVKHRQLRALKFLVDKLGDLVYAKDDDGETLLHWAARTKQVEMVKYLVESNKVEKESKNSMGRTAVGILKESHDDSEGIISIIAPPKAMSWKKTNPILLEYLSKKREQTMVVMTLIATMAFQAAVSPPGGVWQDDTSSHRAGEAVIATTHPKIYKHLVRANTTAFVSSLITIFLVAVPFPIGRGALFVFTTYVMRVSMAAISVSYGGSVLVSAPNTQTRSLTGIINVVLAVSLGLFGIKLVRNIVMMCCRRLFGSRFVDDDLSYLRSEK
ncbi:ankyrin repeat-containing protein NPR4-like [Salvia hispanica]|uniref:ankyrin repeat-containing protein NPR4-like n=1 Tax=Salvia hispanica TaxID=49212 RepID=UPI0020091E74|nr:ankyrin repeat-containing protein NPR4-like [Salvia hispanica]